MLARRRNVREALLLRQRQRVVNLASDSGALQMIEHAVAGGVIGEPNDVLVVNVLPFRQLARQHDAIAELRLGEKLRVNRRIAPPSLRPGVEMRQLDVKNGGLQRVDAEVAANVSVVVLRPHSVYAEVDELFVRAF